MQVLAGKYRAYWGTQLAAFSLLNSIEYFTGWNVCVCSRRLFCGEYSGNPEPAVIVAEFFGGLNGLENRDSVAVLNHCAKLVRFHGLDSLHAQQNHSKP